GPRAASQVVVLSQGRQPRRSAAPVPGCTTEGFTDYLHFHKSAPGLVPDAFAVRGGSAYVGAQLREIRRDPACGTPLILTDRPVAGHDAALADGPLVDDRQALAARIDETRARRSAMAQKGDDRGAEALLLEYMWLRPGYVLEPAVDWQHPRRYR